MSTSHLLWRAQFKTMLNPWLQSHWLVAILSDCSCLANNASQKVASVSAIGRLAWQQSYADTKIKCFQNDARALWQVVPFTDSYRWLVAHYIVLVLYYWSNSYINIYTQLIGYGEDRITVQRWKVDRQRVLEKGMWETKPFPFQLLQLTATGGGGELQ